MTRVAWALFAVLVLTGLGWWLIAQDGDDEAPAPDDAVAEPNDDAPGPGLSAGRPMPTDVPTIGPLFTDAGQREQQRREDHKQAEAERSAQERGNELVKPSIERVVQDVDANGRLQGMAELLDFLRGDRYEAIAALRAYWKFKPLDVDHQALRDAALAYARDDDFFLRAAALGAIRMLGFRPRDELLVVPLASSESVQVRRTAVRLLPGFTGELFNQAVSDAVLALLDDDVPNVVWQLAWDLPTKDLPPAIVTRLVEIARSHPDATTRYRVLRGAVADLDPKTKEVVDYLLEHATAEPRTREFALRGLSTHVPDELAPYVADRLMEQLRTVEEEPIRYDLIAPLGRVGDARHATALAQIAEDPTATDRLRRRAATWAKAIKRRKR